MAKDYCREELKFNHETFYCGEYEHEDDKPHTNVTGLWPPCPNCLGIDSHTTDCPNPIVANGKACVVTWFTGQKPKITMERR